jgi:hypothetical protein
VEDIQRLQAAMNKMREAGIHQVLSDNVNPVNSIVPSFALPCYFTLPKASFPLGGILCAEQNFSLSCDFSDGTN